VNGHGVVIGREIVLNSASSRRTIGYTSRNGGGDQPIVVADGDSSPSFYTQGKEIKAHFTLQRISGNVAF
jgi:hypothetical protein